MKRPVFTLIIVLLLSSSNMLAQQSKLSLSIRSGLSIPFGDYASRELENGCFTTTGIGFVAEADYQVYGSFYASFHGGAQFHPVDVASLGLAKVLEDPFMSDLYIRSESYRIIHLSAGISYTTALINKLQASGKVLAGMFISQTPYQIYRPQYYLMGPDYFVITSARDRSFAYGGGFDLIYPINDCISLQFGSEALLSEAAFGFISAGSVRTDWRKISFININLGFHMRF